MPPIRTARLDPARLDDAVLVDLARAGDVSAFREIMQRYNRRLYRIARGILHDESEAEDVVQETYLRAFANLAGFRGEAALSTWLTRIALNEALGRVRRRRPAVELDEIERAQEAKIVMFPLNPDKSDPEMAAARTEVRRLLEHAVDELPESFRLVFVMRDIEEMSVEETAAHLGVKPETVKTRLHRARRLLRKALDEKLASVLTDAFPFAGARCARISEAVLDRLGLGTGQA